MDIYTYLSKNYSVHESIAVNMANMVLDDDDEFLPPPPAGITIESWPAGNYSQGSIPIDCPSGSSADASGPPSDSGVGSPPGFILEVGSPPGFILEVGRPPIDADYPPGFGGPDASAQDPDDQNQDIFEQSHQDMSADTTSQDTPIATPDRTGSINNPLVFEKHSTQTTYRNICSFSCRSKTWVSIGHITTNIFRCPNLATGRYFCDGCYDVIVRKNNVYQKAHSYSPHTWVKVRDDVDMPQTRAPRTDYAPRTERTPSAPRTGYVPRTDYVPRNERTEYVPRNERTERDWRTADAGSLTVKSSQPFRGIRGQ